MKTFLRSKNLSEWPLDIDNRDITSYKDDLIRFDLALLWALLVHLRALFT
jgi:hypothetical protein